MAIKHNERSIVDFRSRMKGGGARSNLFEVQMTFPNFAEANTETLNDIPFLVKAAEIPASTIEIFLFHSEVVFFQSLEIEPLHLGQ